MSFYLEQQRAEIVAQCPLPDVPLHLVAAYATATMDDMWARPCMADEETLWRIFPLSAVALSLAPDRNMYERNQAHAD
jgi:hypothetical protein